MLRQVVQLMRLVVVIVMLCGSLVTLPAAPGPLLTMTLATPLMTPSPSSTPSPLWPTPVLVTPKPSQPQMSFESSIRAAASEVTAFKKSRDVSRLQSADAILGRSAIYTLDGAENLRRRRELVRDWIGIFKVIDLSIDPTYNDKDIRQLPALSLSPPRERSGRQLFSGADPRDVQDPVARATYEAKLRVNNRKALRANFQESLRSLDESSLDLLRIVLSNYRPFTPPDTAALTAIIESGGLSSQRVAKIIALM